MVSETVSKYKSPKSKAEPSGSKVGAVALAPKYVFAKLFTEFIFVATVLIEATVPEAPKAVISVSNPATVLMLAELLLTAVTSPAILFTPLISVLILFRFVISVPNAPNVPISVATALTAETLLVGEICPATKFTLAELVSTLVTLVLIL